MAGVWLCNGLIFKLLNGLPRHLQIVQSMPGLSGSRGTLAIKMIGTGEVLLAGWVVSGLRPRTCAAFQTAAVLTMNSLELIFARNHLLSPVGLVPLNCLFLSVAWCAAELRSSEPFYWLRRHPFAVDAFFQESLVLTYALPRQVLQPLLPPGLTLDTFGDYGVLAVAIVQTKRLRPRGFPRLLGQDFLLTGYRIFTTLHQGGRTRRGLFILRSDADRLRMVLLGNLLTHYKYGRCRAHVMREPGRLTIQIDTPDGDGDLTVVATIDGNTQPLPKDSIFKTAHEARRYAGPLPYTFDYESTTDSMVIVKGERQAWEPQLVNVDAQQLTYLQQPLFAGAILCSAFHVHDIPYRWHRGIRLPLSRKAGE